jgi:hypothetical protein
MRRALLIAASVLVAGCSTSTDGSARSTTPASTAGGPTSPVSTTPSVAPRSPSASPPQRGAAIADVIAWIEAGAPADAAGYHSMTRAGQSTALDDGVAFTTAGTEANCVTDDHHDGALACLLKLTDPPPRPSGVETMWKGNWIDFPGPTVDVGSPHGDPGPFVDGTGAVLPAGQALAFGDYRCRPDSTGLYCVNYAHQTAVKMSAAGVEGFGCLKTVAPPADIGIRLSC